MEHIAGLTALGYGDDGLTRVSVAVEPRFAGCKRLRCYFSAPQRQRAELGHKKRTPAADQDDLVANRGSELVCHVRSRDAQPNLGLLFDLPFEIPAEGRYFQMRTTLSVRTPPTVSGVSGLPQRTS
jgi:hypothetical protein